MTIELSREAEAQLQETARARGISVGQYLEGLVSEKSLRDRQISDSRSAIAERVAALGAGDVVDGEEVMARLIAEVA